jgi:hypothetical protein
MSHFAKVENNLVTQVIVAEPDFISTGALGDPAAWVQTSYNTQGGEHTQGGTPLRGNYAGVGYTYDAQNDVFYAPQPFPSWTIAAPTWTWTAPTPMPQDGKQYAWNEATKSWDAVTVTA